MGTRKPMRAPAGFACASIALALAAATCTGASSKRRAPAAGGADGGAGARRDGGACGRRERGEAAWLESSNGGGGDGGATITGAGGGGAADAGMPLGKVVGGYYPNWTDSPPRIRDVDVHYNVIYLFAATPVGGAPGTTGAVTFAPPGDGQGAATHLNDDIAYARSTQGRKILLSVGGAGNGMSFPDRAKSQAFVDSIVGIYGDLGGFDGIDWDTFEGQQTPDTSEMIWISLQLKGLYTGFLITAPPAPWRDVDKAFCSAMLQAGALDYAAPQYYDGPDLATEAYLTSSVDEWTTLLGEGHVVVGFGVSDQPNYWSIADAVAAWDQVDANHPALRGAFDWQIDVDEGDGWPFADQLGPLIAP